MKLPKELDEKLRRLLSKIEEPLNDALENNRFTFNNKKVAIHINSLEALQLREEIIALIGYKVPEGVTLKQMDIEEEIQKTKHENY